MKRGKKTFAALAVLAVAGTGCGDKRDTHAATPPPAQTQEFHGTREHIGINLLANEGRAAVVGKVTAVMEPMPFTKALMYDQYHDATVVVEEVLFDSAELRVTPGALLTIHTLGSGKPEGEQEATPDRTPIYTSQYNGSFKVGDTVLLVLGNRGTSMFPDGPGIDAQVMQGYQGQWTITADGNAISAERSRSADAAKLKARLKAERARGRNPAVDRCTVSDPFGDEKPGCADTP